MQSLYLWKNPVKKKIFYLKKNSPYLLKDLYIIEKNCIRIKICY